MARTCCTAASLALACFLLVLLAPATSALKKERFILSDYKLEYFNGSAGPVGAGAMQTFLGTYTLPGSRGVTRYRSGTCLKTTVPERIPALWICTDAYEMDGGHISTSGIMYVNLPYWNGTLAVTGGTGRYTQARGEVIFGMYAPTRSVEVSMRLLNVKGRH